jgi:hypothetical protein
MRREEMRVGREILFFAAFVSFQSQVNTPLTERFEGKIGKLVHFKTETFC